jgi:methionyl-tRNA synthetase
MNNFYQLLSQPYFYFPFLIWNIFWKGWALWKSSQKKHLLWFVTLLIINTTGLLEIAYIFFLNKWNLDNGKLLNFLETKFSKKK